MYLLVMCVSSVIEPGVNVYVWDSGGASGSFYSLAVSMLSMFSNINVQAKYYVSVFESSSVFYISACDLWLVTCIVF